VRGNSDLHWSETCSLAEYVLLRDSLPSRQYRRGSAFVSSLLPRCHGLLGSQKYTLPSVATVNLACSLSSVPLSKSKLLAVSRRPDVAVWVLSFGERAEISCGIAAGDTFRAIARDWLKVFRCFLETPYLNSPWHISKEGLHAQCHNS
jgi:hypothetical protein